MLGGSHCFGTPEGMPEHLAMGPSAPQGSKEVSHLVAAALPAGVPCSRV